MAELRGLLEDQARRSRTWNITWTIGYGAAAAGQLAFAVKPEWAPIDIDPDMQKSLYIGAIKASIGMVSRMIIPLRAIQPDPDIAEPCAGATAAEEALRITARKQKVSFWLNHLGGVAVNLSGALVLGIKYDAWGAAASSFALGYAVGLLNGYTQPDGAWKEPRRQRSSTVTVAPLPNGLAIVGTF
ncbi:MAG TPA: hypothetical protein VML75_15055 [Kofleriaceae bacterium]|nr:hypothetical protein [Kofleriaceae bacterium]